MATTTMHTDKFNLVQFNDESAINTTTTTANTRHKQQK